MDKFSFQTTHIVAHLLKHIYRQKKIPRPQIWLRLFISFRLPQMEVILRNVYWFRSAFPLFYFFIRNMVTFPLGIKYYTNFFLDRMPNSEFVFYDEFHFSTQEISFNIDFIPYLFRFRWNIFVFWIFVCFSISKQMPSVSSFYRIGSSSVLFLFFAHHLAAKYIFHGFHI